MIEVVIAYAWHEQGPGLCMSKGQVLCTPCQISLLSSGSDMDFTRGGVCSRGGGHVHACMACALSLGYRQVRDMLASTKHTCNLLLLQFELSSRVKVGQS